MHGRRAAPRLQPALEILGCEVRRSALSTSLRLVAWRPPRSRGRLPHEVHLISPLLKWNNPFFGDRAPAYAWAHPMMLCLWRPGAPPAAPTWVVASLVAPLRTHHSRFLHLRRCKKCNCGRIRVLPRHVDPASVPVHNFCVRPAWRRAACIVCSARVYDALLNVYLL